MQVRRNRHWPKLIEQSIAIEATKGAAQAWGFLVSNLIPVHIVARILAKSARRRAADDATSRAERAQAAELGA